MAKRLIEHDDELDSDEVMDDETAKQVIYQSFMEDISGILNQAYVDIEAKVSKLVDALGDV